MAQAELHPDLLYCYQSLRATQSKNGKPLFSHRHPSGDDSVDFLFLSEGLCTAVLPFRVPAISDPRQSRVPNASFG